jgi:hypothetical protein
LASEVPAAGTDFSNSVIFSVGCHAGLNVPDAVAGSTQAATDWAQVFSRQGATFIGNTGYGYGDSDLIAYSEALALNFAAVLNANNGATVAIGDAVRLAKQQYFGSLGPNALSNYDEKVIAIWTLYGLPMRAVRIPLQSGPETSAPRQEVDVARSSGSSGLAAATAVTYTVAITPALQVVDTADGRYYAVAGEIHALAGRPIEPRLSVDLDGSGGIAHGALLVGGRTHDEAIDPLIVHITTDDSTMSTEPQFDSTAFYPGHIAAVNRLLQMEADVLQRMVLVPGQFRATSSVTHTIGIQRIWERMDVVTFHAPFSTSDFIAPTIWRMSAQPASNAVRFTVEATDASGVGRVVILCRWSTSAEWQPLELALVDAAKGAWSGLLPVAGTSVEYIVQAVDEAGNVMSADDYGSPFVSNLNSIYLPTISR